MQKSLSAEAIKRAVTITCAAKPNSGMDIPIAKPNKPGPSKFKEKCKKHVPPKRPTPYVSDSVLISRVKQYMQDHNQSGATGAIDVEEMAEELRDIYPEYGRRKRGPFKQGVRNAFELINKTWGGSSDMSDWGVASDMSDFSSASDKDADLDEAELQTAQAKDKMVMFNPSSFIDNECNRTNDQMLAMYMRQQPPQNKSRKRPRSDDGEKELINISSDDEITKNDDLEVPKPKPQNGGAIAIPTVATVKMPNAIPIQARTIILPRPAIANHPPSHIAIKAVPATAIPTPKKKKKWKEVGARKPSVTFKDFGGNSKAIEEVCQLLIHIRHPEVYKQIGITPPRGFLLHGPPGCGKTLLAHAISGELGVPLLNVSGPELIAGVSGESEERIRELFEQAVEDAPCILFLDEVDALAPNRHTAQREMERRIVAQLLSCLDDLGQKENGDRVVVIGATNRPDALDPALRRAGRFDREVCLGIPDKNARVHILRVLCSKLKLASQFSYEMVATNTPGFVGADLMALTREASMVAVNRVFASLKKVTDIAEPEEKLKIDVAGEAAKDELAKNELTIDENAIKTEEEKKATSKEASSHSKSNIINSNSFHSKSNEVFDFTSWLHKEQCPLSEQQLNELHVELDDFMHALKFVQPSAKREGFATVPDVTWDDVGSLQDIREELQITILAPVRHPEQFAELGISTPSGVLLCGPPGCGKTLLAKAVANEAGINFISVKGPELLNMYVGESEKAVRQCFQRARNSAPCVIFFDELDALCPKRSDSGEGGASMRVVNQMLTEMDGIESRKGVFLMAASNRPEIIDPAVLRPGRLDKILFIGLPSSGDRVEILKTLTKNGTRPKLDADVNLKSLGESTECSGYTGADLAALVREAAIQALKEAVTASNIIEKIVVSDKHFKTALQKIRPSVSEKDQQHYEKIQKLYSSTKS